MTWGNKEFILHFYNGNSQKVTLTEAGLADSVKAQIDRDVINRPGGLKDQIRNEVRKVKNGPVKYDTRNSYEFGDILYALGSSSVKTLFVGTCAEQDAKIKMEGQIKLNYIDDFTDVIRLIEKTFGTSHPSGLPDWLKDIMNLGGDSYPVVEEWVEEFSETIE